MPIEVRDVSFSQFAELLAIDAERLIGVQVDRRTQRIGLLLEPEDAVQTSGSFPQLTKGGKKIGGKKSGGKRGC